MPPSEDIAQAKINRGQRARQLLDDPTLNEAFDALIAEANATSENSGPDEVDLREECYRAKNAIKALRKKLGNWVSGGTIEQMHIDELNAKEKLHAVQ
jgi:dihydropteroate synthase